MAFGQQMVLHRPLLTFDEDVRNHAAITVRVGPMFLQRHGATGDERFQGRLGGKRGPSLRSGLARQRQRRHFDRGQTHLLADFELEGAAVEDAAHLAGADGLKLAAGCGLRLRACLTRCNACGRRGEKQTQKNARAQAAASF